MVSLLLASGLCTSAVAQQVVKKIPVTSTEYEDIYYWEHLPNGYSGSGEEYPVIIFLHGASEQGAPGGGDIDKVLKNGPPKLINEGDDMTFTVNGTTHSFIVISPQLQYSTKDNWSPSYIHDVVQHVLKNYRVDEDRVYLTGLSMGGGTLWNYQGQHPNVAAAIGILSSGWPYDPFLVQQAIDNHLPVWAFHSRGDNVISVDVPQQWQDSLVALGADPKPRLTIYPQDGHNTWDQGYATDHSHEDPNLYEWFLTHTRYQASTPDPNQPPVARAGDDVTVQLPVDQVQLDGSTSSDPDGTIGAYAWSQEEGPTDATLTGQNTSSLVATDLREGIYTFQLQVTDDQGAKATDRVRVTISEAPPPANEPPVADAGPDITVQLPADPLKVEGYASTDPDGSIVTYAWSQVSGPSEATLDGEDSDLLTLTDLKEGVYVFQLKVIDDKDAEGTDQVQVTVTAAPPTPNQPPVARAGADTTVQLPVDQIVLDGSPSADPDGTIEEYDWRQVEGSTNVILGEKDTDVLTVSNLREGVYTFELRVTDNEGAEATDQVVVTVTAAPGPTNQPPVAQAGADTTVQLPVDQIQLNATTSDPDGTIETYAWSQVDGPTDATLAGQGTDQLTVTDLSEGAYTFQVLVTDDQGAEATDRVQVTVLAAPTAPNQPPVAQAGADTTVQLPVDQLLLDGRASTDPDDSIAAYGWSQVSGPSDATLAGQDSTLLSISQLSEGTYVFQLQVTDQAGASATDEVQVVVTPSVITGLGDDSISSRTLVAYPNPAHDRMTILFGNPAPRKGVLQLVDVVGKVVRRWELPLARENNGLQIDTKAIPVGMYLLHLSANQSYTTKVFIER